MRNPEYHDVPSEPGFHYCSRCDRSIRVKAAPPFKREAFEAIRDYLKSLGIPEPVPCGSLLSGLFGRYSPFTGSNFNL